jgi:hypothetical protein
MGNSIPEEAKSWNKYCTEILESIDPSYTCLKMESMTALQIIVFSKLKNVSVSDSLKKNMGTMGFANKGGLSVSFIYLRSSFKVIICHLNSGQSKKSSDGRIDQLKALVPELIPVDDTPVKKVIYSLTPGLLLGWAFRLNQKTKSGQLLWSTNSKDGFGR